MGAYRDDAGKPYILSCVKKATAIIQQKGLDHEYAGIQGIDSFIDKSIKLAYGHDSPLVKEGKIAGAQTISGTGAIRLGFEFLGAHYPKKNAQVLIPKETWPIHRTIAEKTGFKWTNLRYYEPKTKTLDITGYLEDLNKADNESIAIMHVCAHNPTGIDPTKD